METADIFWVIAWFIAGLLTFQITSLKNILTTISIIITGVSIIIAFDKPDDLLQLIADYPISYIAGSITTFVYLIGANLIRGYWFDTDTNWGRIIFYAFMIAFLLFILNSFPAPVPTS
jgi:hypothetical protein